MSTKENDLVSKIILKYRYIWSVDTVPYIFDPEHTWEYHPEWDNPTPNYSEEISEIRRILDGPPDLGNIDTPQKLLVAINYWLRFIKVFSQDKDLKKLDCSVIVRKGFKLSSKAEVFLDAPIGESFDSETSVQELEKIRTEIYRLDKSLYKTRTPKNYFFPENDYKDVRWARSKFKFSPKQAEIVKILHDAFKERNPEMSQARIIKKLGVSSKTRVIHYFKNPPHPAWDTLIIKGERKGTRRLDI